MTDQEIELNGRLIRVKSGIFFLCKDGTVAEANDIILSRVLTGFKNPDLISGNQGRWDIISDNMYKIPGDTLAIIRGQCLIIYDSCIFNNILSGVNPNEYVTVHEYAKMHNKGVSRIKKLCGDGRISGAVLKGGKWFIPKLASYPEDLRKYNKNK